MHNSHNIPTIKRYGEQDIPDTPDLLHCEALILRSKQHQFKIKPHRHHGLTQLFYLKEGSGEANIDGESLQVKAPMLIVISEMSVHDFLWSQDVCGIVLSIASPLINELQTNMGKETLVLKNTTLIHFETEQPALDQLLNLLLQEYQASPQESRSIALKSITQLLCIWLERYESKSLNPKLKQSRAAKHFKAFVEKVDLDFHQQRSVESYANEMGITAPYLNQLCQSVVGKNALQIIHDRVLLEAKRNLIYTVQSINEIAYQLGFNDPAYFTRFVKRLTGSTPKMIRVKATRHNSDSVKQDLGGS